MKYQIKLKNIGRNKHSETIVCDYPTLQGVELRALNEVNKWLLSSTVELIKHLGGDYSVYVGGFRKVGDVIIEVVK